MMHLPLKPLLLTTILTLALPLAFAAEPTPTVDELLQNWVKAAGGRAAMEKIQSRTVKGTFEMTAFGVNSPFEYRGKAPNKRATSLEVPGMGAIREGFDGQVAWSTNPGQGTSEKTGADLARAKREAVFHRELNFKAQFDKLELKGRAELPGGAAWILEATPKEGRPERFYFDAKSGLLVRQDATVDAPQGDMEIEVHFEDYREVDGMQLAHALHLIRPVQMAFTIRFTEVKHNMPLNDAEFAKPSN